MKYYSEQETKELRLALEAEVLNWPHVSTKKMFGCPCYQAKGKLFAFLVTNGVVITQLQQADRDEMSRQHQTSFFQAGKKTVKNWIRLSIKNKKDLDSVMPFVKKSYEEALLKT
jgi:hypothetical protein